MSLGIVQSLTNEGTASPQQQLHGTSGSFTNPTQAGNAIVALWTVSDYAGIHTGLSASDTQGNAYTQQNQTNTNPTGGAESTALFTASNIPGDVSTPDVVSFFFSPDSVEDYQASFNIEVTGVGPNPVVAQSGNVQNALAPGTANINSGNIVITAAMLPCILVAMAFNSSDAGSNVYTPTPGAGMTLIQNCWAFNLAYPIACVAYQIISTAGTYGAGLFNQASNAAEDIGCNAVVLQASVVAPTLLGQICI